MAVARISQAVSGDVGKLQANFVLCLLASVSVRGVKVSWVLLRVRLPACAA